MLDRKQALQFADAASHFCVPALAGQQHRQVYSTFLVEGPKHSIHVETDILHFFYANFAAGRVCHKPQQSRRMPNLVEGGSWQNVGFQRLRALRHSTLTQPFKQHNIVHYMLALINEFAG